jgi:ADP-ribose 1''-phosphate phosphatase
MVNGKKSSDGHAPQNIVHKVPLPTDNSTTMAQSAKPKSSTSEATITKTKKYKIRRCTESDEEDIEHLMNKHTESKTTVTKSVKPKTDTAKQQVIRIQDESDDEEPGSESEDDEEDSEDDQTNSRKSVKATSLTIKEQVSSKKSTKKRALDSDDDDVVDLTNKSKKSKSKATSSSSSKKHTNSESDSEDDIVEMTNKPTTSKSKSTQKQPIKPGNSTPTKKKQIFTTSKAPEPESSEEEEDSSSDEGSPNITLTERIGNLFDAPSNTLLVHACNCVGSWNAGIALTFQKNYPAHYSIYQAHCKSRTPNSLLSTCLLIPPQPGSGPNHWIGCLFTSRKYGRGKDSKDDILDSTDSALQDMLEQLEDVKKKPKGVWMCKINSGSFKVPWSQTKKLIEALTFKGGLQIDVVDKKGGREKGMQKR